MILYFRSCAAGNAHLRLLQCVPVSDHAGLVPGLLKTLSPASLSVVVEALGKAGVQDVELFAKIADHVSTLGLLVGMWLIGQALSLCAVEWHAKGYSRCCAAFGLLVLCDVLVGCEQVARRCGVSSEGGGMW